MEQETLNTLFIVIIAPVLTHLSKRWPIFEKLSGPINATLCVLMSVGAWKVFDGDLMTLETSIVHGLAAAGVVSAIYQPMKHGARTFSEQKFLE